MKVGDLVRYGTSQYPRNGDKPLGIVVKVWPHGNLKVKVFMRNAIWICDQPHENFEKVEGDDESG
jgi:hypothetical protein